MPELLNQASLAYNDIITNSNIVSASYTDELSMSVSASCCSYNAGDSATFSISIINSSAENRCGLNLNCSLGGYSHSCGTLVPLNYTPGSARYYINGVQQACPEPDCGEALAFRGLQAPAGGNAMIQYSVQVNQFAPLGKSASICITAGIDGGCCGPITAETTLQYICKPSLSISKSVCPDKITCGRPLTYTILLQNSGAEAASACENIIVTDLLDPRFSITDVRFNDAPWSNPANYSYNSATGLFISSAGQISVPAASFCQNMSNGTWTITPGVSKLTITGSLCGG